MLQYFTFKKHRTLQIEELANWTSQRIQMRISQDFDWKMFTNKTIIFNFLMKSPSAFFDLIVCIVQTNANWISQKNTKFDHLKTCTMYDTFKNTYKRKSMNSSTSDLWYLGGAFIIASRRRRLIVKIPLLVWQKNFMISKFLNYNLGLSSHYSNQLPITLWLTLVSTSADLTTNLDGRIFPKTKLVIKRKSANNLGIPNYQCQQRN